MLIILVDFTGKIDSVFLFQIDYNFLEWHFNNSLLKQFRLTPCTIQILKRKRKKKLKRARQQKISAAAFGADKFEGLHIVCIGSWLLKTVQWFCTFPREFHQLSHGNRKFWHFRSSGNCYYCLFRGGSKIFWGDEGGAGL